MRRRTRTFLGFIAANVRTARKSLGMTQEQLAEIAGFDPRDLRRVERGQANLTIDSLVKLSDGLEKKPSDLLKRATRNGCLPHGSDAPLVRNVVAAPSRQGELPEPYCSRCHPPTQRFSGPDRDSYWILVTQAPATIVVSQPHLAPRRVPGAAQRRLDGFFSAQDRCGKRTQI